MGAPLESATGFVTHSAKLRPPRVRHHELTREALLTEPHVRDAEILAISAPAGFGKSTLAIQWATRTGVPQCWLTCDATDGDALVLMNGLVASLMHADVGYVAPAITPALDEPTFSASLLPRFGQSVSELRTPITVVIDDIHLVTGDQSQKVLRAFVDSLPEGSQVALVGRSVGTVPIPLWRGQGRVVDLYSEDLAFRARETRDALEEFRGTAVTDEEVEQVHTATRGWPVAVFLMSQTGRSYQVADSIEDYIRTEVLAPMPPKVRRFVLETAALGVVNVDLAEAATGQRRSAHYLHEAITTVLLQHTDDDCFRYHPLLQECAVSLLSRDDPDRLGELRARAARWHMRAGHVETAVGMALASRDVAALADVLWPASRISLLHGRTTTVINWLSDIDEATLLGKPELSLAAAWTFMAASDFGKMLRYLDATLKTMPSDWRADLTTSPHLAPELAVLLALTGFTLSGPQEAVDLAEEALAAMAPDDPTRALAGLIVGLNLTLIGEPTALNAMHRAAAIAGSAGIPSSQVEALAMLGLLLMGQGDDSAGCEAVEQADQVYAFHELAEMTATSGVLAIGRVARTAFRGTATDTQAAIDILQDVRPHLEPLLPWYRPLAGAVLAFVCVRTGDLEGFRRYVAWCEESDAPAAALCRRWAARARQEYAIASPLQTLSPAELRVWDLLRGRMTLSEIGQSLFLSRETVKSHAVSIYRKLGVASRREAQDLAESWR
jgi:LuxR family maltose regulon positive regulatory protein